MRAQLLQGEHFTPTIYLYDNQPGGIGLAERIFEVLPGPARARPRDARGLRLPERLPVVRGTGERGGPPGQADRA